MPMRQFPSHPWFGHRVKLKKTGQVGVIVGLIPSLNKGESNSYQIWIVHQNQWRRPEWYRQDDFTYEKN